MSEVQKWAPWALDNLQPWKRLLSLAANVLVVLALAQVAGVDIEKLTGGAVVPPVPWWGTGALATLALLVESRLANAQEIRLREAVGVASVPPAPPAA